MQNNMIQSAEHLHAELIQETRGLSESDIAARLATKGDTLRTLAALYRCYNRARISAHKFGFTGHRRYTYAESRMAQMQQRLDRGLA